MSSDSFYSVFFLLDNRFFYLDAKNLKKTEHFLSDFLHLSTRSSVSSLPVPFYLVFYSLQFFSKNLFFILDFVHLSTRSSAFLLCFLFLTILCTQYFLSFYSIFFIFILDFVDLPTQSSAACFDDILHLSTRVEAEQFLLDFLHLRTRSSACYSPVPPPQAAPPPPQTQALAVSLRRQATPSRGYSSPSCPPSRGRPKLFVLLPTRSSVFYSPVPPCLQEVPPPPQRQTLAASLRRRETPSRGYFSPSYSVFCLLAAYVRVGRSFLFFFLLGLLPLICLPPRLQEALPPPQRQALAASLHRRATPSRGYSSLLPTRSSGACCSSFYSVFCLLAADSSASSGGASPSANTGFGCVFA